MLISFYLIYFCLAFVIPTIRVYRVNGVNPITFSNSGSAHDLIGLYMKLLMILILISALSYEFYKFEEIFNYKNVSIFGWVLMICSLIVMCMAQMEMKDSWRIGIDEKQETTLRTTGIFSFSRNPIFASLIISLVGNFLVYATILNLVILIMGILLITIQIRLEEEFLLKSHQGKYAAYQSQVKRRLFF